MPENMDTMELRNCIFETDIPQGGAAEAIIEIEPNIPWAEEHFLERVSGIPLNPPPSSMHWGGIDDKVAVKRHLCAPVSPGPNNPTNAKWGFSHTYPERYWSKSIPAYAPWGEGQARGVRYEHGDLNDVVELLRRNPLTRQAFLPVWFPEDTGAVHQERVPCTLGYHFLIREERLHVTYMIRSCDFVRNFRDDVYLTCRLAQWVKDQLFGNSYEMDEAHLGRLTFHAMSMHCFEPDLYRLKKEIKDEQQPALA
jgi:hypothetical protein